MAQQKAKMDGGEEAGRPPPISKGEEGFFVAFHPGSVQERGKRRGGEGKNKRERWRWEGPTTLFVAGLGKERCRPPARSDVKAASTISSRNAKVFFLQKERGAKQEKPCCTV